jgi:hypothetical protein
MAASSAAANRTPVVEPPDTTEPADTAPDAAEPDVGATGDRVAVTNIDWICAIRPCTPLMLTGAPLCRWFPQSAADGRT